MPGVVGSLALRHARVAEDAVDTVDLDLLGDAAGSIDEAAAEVVDRPHFLLLEYAEADADWRARGRGVGEVQPTLTDLGLGQGPKGGLHWAGGHAGHPRHTGGTDLGCEGPQGRQREAGRLDVGGPQAAGLEPTGEGEALTDLGGQPRVRVAALAQSVGQQEALFGCSAGREPAAESLFRRGEVQPASLEVLNGRGPEAGQLRRWEAGLGLDGGKKPRSRGGRGNGRVREQEGALAPLARLQGDAEDGRWRSRS